MKKIITFGDVHGRDIWKYDIETITPNDLYIFVGDYVDSFDLTNEIINKNLLDIIEFKKENPDNVILLWGNHDVQYLFEHGKHRCSGYRPEAFQDLHFIFNENKHLFKLSHEIHGEDEDGNEGMYIWSHAGIHKGWYERLLRDIPKIEKYNHFISDDMTISERLNKLFDLYNSNIFSVSWFRGGHSREGGPLWADFQETYKKPLKNYHQIIGHTMRANISTYENYGNDLTSTTFVDCGSDDYYELLLNNIIYENK